MATIGRRGFLALGVGGVATVALVGLRPWESEPGPTPLAALFGDQRDAVDAMGHMAVAAGVVTDADEAVGALPSAGLTTAERLEGTMVVVEDRDAFVAAFDAEVAAELEAGALVFVGGYPLTPTEAALAAAVHTTPA
ncbi:MAG: hypothetical protein JJU45_18320 [Acidimicrobiia bacterium]|nr:hypothetical protein [Acidimicrobiia bacterium]